MTKDKFDIHQAITDKIVTAIEAGAGDFVMPWHRKTGGLKPRNVASGNFYQGVNVLALWVDAQSSGFASNVWGTYRQWTEKGPQVRKGTKAAHVVFYKQIEYEAEDDSDDTRQTRLFARATPVFNADQVDGWEDVALPVIVATEAVTVLPAVEAFLAGTGASISYGGDRAYYQPSTDQIQIPERDRFFGSSVLRPQAPPRPTTRRSAMS